MMTTLQMVGPELAGAIEEFRKTHPSPASGRVFEPAFRYYGEEILQMAAAALLEGANLLLSGPKATGKNVLAENLAWMFGRPVYNVSFHVNTDSAALIGCDTFADGAVTLRKGVVYRCAEEGGFGVLDEINMAKNEAAAVLHATLDHRRIIDVPGYDRIRLHDATRFIGTMNYGYAGTRELNEALVSRFLVVEMPMPDEDTLGRILSDKYPALRPTAREQFSGLFLDLVDKNRNGELSTKSIDLRGLIDALGVIRRGVPVKSAVRMGLANKSFDLFERDIIEDVMATRLPDAWTAADVFDA